jgi:HK97 family phage portal protein
MVSWALWGNAYGLIVTRDRMEYPTTIEWLHPERVQVVEESTLDAAPMYRLDGTIIDPQRIIHRPGRYVVPGSRIGIAPLERFRETFGLALAARNYGSRWFGEGAHPSSVLTTEQVLTPEVAKTIKERFIAATRGRREPAVLGAGMSWKATQVAPNESQFMETNNASAVAIARSFGLPADMIDAYSQGSMTYANREQRALDFLTFSADPWLVRVEDLVTSLMPRTKYAKFNRAALLRTDSKTQAEVIDLKIRSGVLTAAEARRLLDMKPEPDEGELLWPPYSTAPTGAMP